jgi:hypothetical protein
MPIRNFPGNIGTPLTVGLSDATDNLFEAVEVYSVPGKTNISLSSRQLEQMGQLDFVELMFLA